MTQVSTVVQGGTKLTGNVALSATESISLPAGSGILAADGDVTLEANRFFTANPAAGSTGIQLTDAVIQTLGSGNIRLEGVGASVAAGTDRHGVNISSAGTGSLVQAIGTGSVTILGIAGAGTNFNSGVRIIGPNTQVTTASGNLTLEGTGQGSGFANNGVAITNATVEVGGDITITGISSFAAGANNGVNLGATGPVRMVARNISITGTSVPSDAINFVNAQLNATNQITLTGDSMALAAASTIFAGNNVRIRQKTVGGHIALGGAIPGTFVIPNALLDAISTSIVTVGEQSPDIATSSIRFAAAIGPFTGFNTLALNTTGLVTRLPGVGPLTINTLAIKAGQGVGTGALAFSTVARNLAVEAGSVGVYLTNLGPLSLMSLAAAGIQGFVSTGPISITTTTGATPGRLEVQTNMTSRQGPITLRTTDAATPGQDIVVAPRVAIRSWKKNILLQAGDNLTLNPGAVLIAQEKAGAPMANVFLNVDYSSTDAGVGGVANLTGQLPLAIARGLTITGGPQGDQFNVSPFNPKPNTHPPTPIVVNGAGGSDRMTVALPTGTIFHSGGTSIPSGTVIVHNPPAIGGNAKISYVNLEFPVTITRLANVRPVIGAAGPVANQPVSLSTAAVINPLGNVFISDPDTQAMLITVRIASGAVLGDFLGAVASGWTLQPPTHPTNIVYTRTVMGANVGALAQSAVRNLKFRPFATTAVGQKIVFTVTVNDGSGNVANTFEISAVVTP